MLYMYMYVCTHVYMNTYMYIASPPTKVHTHAVASCICNNPKHCGSRIRNTEEAEAPAHAFTLNTHRGSISSLCCFHTEISVTRISESITLIYTYVHIYIYVYIHMYILF